MMSDFNGNQNKELLNELLEKLEGEYEYYLLNSSIKESVILTEIKKLTEELEQLNKDRQSLFKDYKKQKEELLQNSDDLSKLEETKDILQSIELSETVRKPAEGGANARCMLCWDNCILKCPKKCYVGDPEPKKCHVASRLENTYCRNSDVLDDVKDLVETVEIKWKDDSAE